MIFELENGEKVRLPDISDDMGIVNCSDFVVREGECFGEAVLRSGCECPFCHRMRVEIEEEGWTPAKTPPGETSYSFVQMSQRG